MTAAGFAVRAPFPSTRRSGGGHGHGHGHCRSEGSLPGPGEGFPHGMFVSVGIDWPALQALSLCNGDPPGSAGAV